MTKTSLAFDYSVELDGIGVFKNEELEKVKSYSWEDNLCYSPSSGFEITVPPNRNELGELKLLKSKISGLLILKTNVEMHKVAIREHFANLCWKNISADFSSSEKARLETFLSSEEAILLSKLQAAFLLFQKTINLCKTPKEVENFYMETKNTLVLGSYTPINKLEERIDG